MGARDLTTEKPEAGNGDVAEGNRSPALAGSNGQPAQRRSDGASANGNGHVEASETPTDAVVLDAPEAADAVVLAVEASAVEPLDEPAVEGFDAVVLDEPAVATPDGDELEAPQRVDELEAPSDGATPSEGGRRARRRAAKAAKAEPKPRGRAARRAKADGEASRPRGRAAKRAATPATPAARRAQLVATAAAIAAATAEAQGRPVEKATGLFGKIVRRVAAFVAVLLVPASVYALAATDRPTTTLTRADATFLTSQLVTADQRVRRQLVRLRPKQTSAAVAATREASLTARSIALELANDGGPYTSALQRAVKLEARWLEAVGSVLLNPRSPLRGELVARDAELRPALTALPGAEGRRRGGARQLVRYAQSRVAAN